MKERMKKGLYILGLFAFLAVFAACEKCEKPVFTEDPFDVSDNRGLVDSDKETDVIGGTKGGEDEIDPNGGDDGDIVDPDEDEDFDGIVDPDEDEDFDKDAEGK